MTATKKQRLFWLAGKREPEQDVFFRESLANHWTPGDADQWDTCWYTGMPAPEVFEQLAAGKTINHIPGNNSLTVKSNLYHTLLDARRRMARSSGVDSAYTQRLDFFPRTYCMPEDYHALQKAALEKPRQRWILKPKNSARGKGIALVRNVSAVPTDASWMVQEYMDRPHTFNGHKYVLRLYVLVTSLDPLLVYVYREGSAKLASEPYAPDDPDNIYAHLTNPDINATNSRSASPVVFISLANYRRWLREQGHDDETLFARIRDMLTLTLIAARERMLARTGNVRADTSGCYELLGIDCLVDEDLQPRILECNLSPSLDVCAAPQDGGDIEARNKRQLVSDMVALLGINDTAPRKASGSPQERIRARAAGELERAGGFERIYPTIEVDRYLPYFPFPRLSDMVLADAVSGCRIPRPAAARDKALEIIDDSGLALYAGNDASLYRPNPTAAWIWLKASDGENPDDIAEELLARQSPAALDTESAWQARSTVWNTIANWARDGLLIQRLECERLPEARAEDRLDEWHAGPSGAPLRFQVGRFRVAVHAECGAHRRALEQTFLSTGQPGGDSGDTPAERDLHVVQSRRGYALFDARRMLAQDVPLDRLPSAVAAALVKACRDADSVGTLGGILVSRNGTRRPAPSVLFAGTDEELTREVALRFAAITEGDAGYGLAVPRDPGAPAMSLGLPVQRSSQGSDSNAAIMDEWNGSSRTPPSAPALPPGGECDVAAIVLCERPSRSDANSDLHRLDHIDAFARLLPHCVIGGGSRPALEDVSTLWNWLRGQRALCVSDTSALETLAQVLGQQWPHIPDVPVEAGGNLAGTT